MKRILLLLVVPFILASCEKAFINGELDGMWKLHSVETADSVSYPANIRYSFQRHLVMLGEYYDEGFPDFYMAEFDKKGNELVMFKFCKYPANLGVSNMEELEKYYIFSDTVRFNIEVLDDEVLVMNDGERRYSFSKW